MSETRPSRGARPPARPPSRLAVWAAAARPRTLPAAIVPVLVGTAVAARPGPIDLPVAAATLAAALLIQIGTNLANDYYDFLAGADGADRLGPVRVVQAGWLAPIAVRRAALAVLGLAAMIGLFLVAAGGWPILIVGALSLLCAIAYTGGPWPLAYHGLGELFVFVFFGVVAVNGTVFLQRGSVSALSLRASVPVGCLATAILLVNNLRDISTDRRAGKRTLSVRLGEGATRALYVVLIATAFLLTTELAAAGARGAMLALAALPVALVEARALFRRRGAELNRSLAATARLHLAFGVLLSIGLAR